jgi:CRISPR-associated protein Cas1
MSFMYVCDYKARIYIEKGKLVVESKNNLKRMLPLEQLEGLVIFGNASVSTGCFSQLLRMGIPVTFLSHTGMFFGRLESTKHINIERQRKQFKLGEDEEFCLSFSKKIIKSKIHNQSVILRRYNRHRDIREISPIYTQIKNLKNDVNRATTIESIMGYEGNAARLYFKGLSLLADKDFKFRGRSRMPPRDPFNSLLSLGYTLLLYEAYTAIANKGLNPYAGFLHKDRQGHPTLASDLMEEWRAVLVDSLVMSMVNGRKVKKEDFYTKKETGAILIQKNALKKVIGEFENKIRTETSYLDYIDTRMSFRRAIQTQVGALCKTIDNNDVSIYRPIRLR